MKTLFKNLTEKWSSTFVILSILFSFSAAAEMNTYFCQKELEKLPIQANGRVKPLYVHANEMIKFISGKSSIEGLSATQVYCLLTLKSMGMTTDLTLYAPIEHVDLQKFLNVNDKHATFESLLPMANEIRTEARPMKKASASYKKAIGKLMQSLSIYQSITSGQDWQLPVVSNDQVTWQPITEFLTQEKVENFNQQGPAAFIALFEKTNADYISLKGDKHLTEYTYAKLKLPIWSLVLTLLALATLVLFKNFKLGLGLAVVTIIVQTIYMTFRVYISGRAPVTNMYETVMFSGYGALVLALIIGHLRKEKLFVYVGLAYNVCSLMMMNFAGSMLSPNIGPLVPVLRDNFWLSTHVTTIILSYGAYALSWVIANMVIFKKSFKNISKQDENYYSDLIYTSLKYASVLLAAGIILGGVWADYSWGRFWGWDPKETWSLIVLCIYMAILHGRYTSWIRPHVFIPAVAGAFMSVMMAWFGVNYILASGLHSYGFSEGGAIFLGTFFTLQSSFLIFAWIKENKMPMQTNA